MVCRGSSHDFNRLVRHNRHPAGIRANLDFYNRYHPRAQRLHSESRDKATQCHQDATRWYVATGHQRTLRREHRLWLRLVIVAGTFIACCIPTMVVLGSYPAAKDRIESPSFIREATWAYLVASVNAVVHGSPRVLHDRWRIQEISPLEFLNTTQLNVIHAGH